MYVKDLLAEDRNSFLSFEDFKVRYDITCNILHYYGLIRAIPKHWTRLIFANKEELVNGTCVQNHDNLFQAKRIVKMAYDRIIEKKCEQPENTMRKWKNDFQIDDEIWPYSFTMALKSALDIPTRSFQFLFLHRRLPTNKFIHRIGLIDSPNCTFCKENVETLLHLFYECDQTKQFWTNVESFINTIYGLDLSLTKFSIAFGYNVFDPDPFINYVIILGKKYIYRKRCSESRPNFHEFKGLVHFMFQVESHIAIAGGKLYNHNKKWGLYERWHNDN